MWCAGRVSFHSRELNYVRELNHVRLPACTPRTCHVRERENPCPGVSVAPGLIYSPPLDGMEARLLALDVGSASSPAKLSVRAGLPGG